MVKDLIEYSCGLAFYLNHHILNFHISNLRIENESRLTKEVNTCPERDG